MPADIVFMIRTASLQGSGLRALRRELRTLAVPGRKLILDLTGVAEIDSRLAGLILHVAGRLQARGGSLKLFGVQGRVHAFLELLGMQWVLETQPAGSLFASSEAA